MLLNLNIVCYVSVNTRLPCERKYYAMADILFDRLGSFDALK